MSQMDSAPQPLPPEQQAILIEDFRTKDFASFEELAEGLKDLERQGVTGFMGSHGKLHQISHQIERLEELVRYIRSLAKSGNVASDARRYNLATLKNLGFREIVAIKLLPLLGEVDDQLGIPKQ
jgi:hypothetical protein